MKHLVRLAAVAAVLLGVAAPSAKADILATLTSVTNQGGGIWRWSYNFQYQVPVGGSSTILVNDQISIPNFGYLTGNVGFTPGLVNLSIGASNLNSANGIVTVSVSGYPGPPPAPITGPSVVTAATFFVDSTVGNSHGVTGSWFQQNFNGGPATGTTNVTVASIPEPSQLALAGVVGLFVLGGRMLRRRKA